ncbi:phosphotransferase [Actinomadura sp. 3N407]|uniref:phosphotransferase n=1 Tax=Actinomadura sp. 3N407 TaxID=3457423 RepID=UPI003FCC300E
MEDLSLVARAFGLGEVRQTAYLASGIMNRNWRVETTTGTYALKLLCDVPAELAERNAAVLDGLAEAGLPVCAPLRTAAGEALVRVEPREYLVSPWAAGSHREGTDLSLAEVEAFGALTAEIHDALSGQTGVTLPAADVRPRAKVTDPDAAIGKADLLLRHLSALVELTEFDVTARRLLEDRKVLIDKHRFQVPVPGDAPGLFGWIHGDLQYRNILRDGAMVSAVLDWDRIAVKPLGEEVARTAQVQFGGEHGYFDLERVAAFVTGYRTVCVLPRADLADAVERLWWKRLSDYWIFEFHYDRSDHGPDGLMEPSEALLAWWTDRRQDVQEAFAAGT